MNERDKTAHMMQDSAGNSWGTEAHFQAFADLIRADEREACALICDEHSDDPVYCGAAIRARGNK